jgi:Helix-turn-helix domain
MAETVTVRRTRRRSGFVAQREPAGEEDAILTSREARQLLKIGKTKLHELTRRQVIPAYRIGAGKTSGLRYCRKDLLEWLYRQRVGG